MRRMSTQNPWPDGGLIPCCAGMPKPRKPKPKSRRAIALAASKKARLVLPSLAWDARAPQPLREGVAELGSQLADQRPLSLLPARSELAAGELTVVVRTKKHKSADRPRRRVYEYATGDGARHGSLAGAAIHQAVLDADALDVARERQPTQLGVQWLDAMPFDSRRPPQALIGFQPERRLMAAVRRTAVASTAVAATAAECTAACDVVVVTHGADNGPCAPSELWAVKDCALGGVRWRRALPRGSKEVFNWVFDAASCTPLLRFDPAVSQRPLVAVSVAVGAEDAPSVADAAVEVQLVAGPDFRHVFAAGSKERSAIEHWEVGVARGDLLAVRVVPKGLPLSKCLAHYDVAHSNRHGTLHLFWAVHALGHCGQTYTEALPDDTQREWQARVPYRTAMGLPGSPRRQLYDGLVLAFMPFATKVFKETVPTASQHWALPWAQVEPGHPWSYASFSVYADTQSAQTLTGSLHSLKLQGERNVTKEGESAGLDLHVDEENISFTVVLVFGTDLHGFEQLYPTMGVRVGVGCWAFASANAASLLHAVARGGGFRVALVYAIHECMARGHDHKGKPVLKSELRCARE